MSDSVSSQSSHPEPAAGLPTGRIEGLAAMAQCQRQALAQAARARWPTLVLSDATFERWPLGEREVIESLQSWAHSGGQKMILIAREYDMLQRLHPRFVTWRRTWSHLVDARQCSRADPLELPSALWTPHWFVVQLDRVRSIGVAGSDADRIAALRLRLDEWWLRSTPGFAAHPLGL